MKKLKKLPLFKSEDKEREFWDSHSSAEFIDWSKAKKGVFFKVKPTTRTISIRMPEITLARLKARANRMDVPYQSLIKQYLEAALEK